MLFRSTGNRRFWPVKVNGGTKKTPWDLTKEDIEQIWAEALAYYKEGEELFLQGEVADLALEAQAEAMEKDEREGLVRRYLDILLPDVWDNMEIYERRNFIHSKEFGDMKGSVKRNVVSNMEIWSECFGNEPSRMQKKDSHAINGIMKKLKDWDSYKGNKSGIISQKHYGKQRCYGRVLE